MTKNNTAITLPPDETRNTKASLAEVVALEILHDNFSSTADREEFSQAIKVHGITFLYLSNSPLSPPSERDLSVMGRIARSLVRFWPQALVIGGCHD